LKDDKGFEQDQLIIIDASHCISSVLFHGNID